ncbi:MAG: hypothetical protein R3C10_11820 [Pirellulales bacterium]
MSTNAPLQTTQTSDVNGDFYDRISDSYVERDEQSIHMSLLLEPIKVDDQDASDVEEHFCKIEVMPSPDVPDQFELRITNSPFTEELAETISEKSYTIVKEDQGRSRADFVITTSIKDVTYLRNLAKAYRRMVGRGASYPDPNWKWVCRRTADSLDRLADNITEFRRSRVRNT